MELSVGHGFTAEGLWRNKPLPTEGAGILMDDRFPPIRSGMLSALRTLEAWDGIVVLDFERQRSGLLPELVKALSGKRLILPPSYADLSHSSVLVGPWQGACEFTRWLAVQRERFGHVVLDAAPLRVQCRPGGFRRPWTNLLPEGGYPCFGLGCLHCRLPDGSILFWDTVQSFRARLNMADIPFILFRSDLDTLPDSPALPQRRTLAAESVLSFLPDSKNNS